MPRKLRVFLCHASDDKPAVRTLYASLKSAPWIDPWLDEENILPGQDWNLEIEKAIRETDAIVVCLSRKSVSKEGYVQKEIKRALDISDEKPDGTIYIIPLRLDECEVPSRIKKWQYVDYFAPNAHDRLLKSLRLRGDALKIDIPETATDVQETLSTDDGLDLNRFIEIEPMGVSEVSNSFWIGKYPVTNAQYERFLNALDFANPRYWLEFPKYDGNCQLIGDWGTTGANWLQEKLRESKTKKLLPRYWNDVGLGKSQSTHPVVGISWYEASAYCEWLFQNWDSLEESRLNILVKPRIIRLPLETEWISAAGGQTPQWRYSWDKDGKITTSLKEILKRTNVEESRLGCTTAVNSYPLGESPFGVMDMSGNIWEWQANSFCTNPELQSRCGGSYRYHHDNARILAHDAGKADYSDKDIGFRLAALFEWDKDFGF